MHYCADERVFFIDMILISKETIIMELTTHDPARESFVH